jgi:hypothetical protein
MAFATSIVVPPPANGSTTMSPGSVYSTAGSRPPPAAFIEFIEAKFAAHGVEKVLPNAAVVEAHARRLIEQRSPTTHSPRSANSSPTKRDQVLPDDLGPVVRAYLDSHPSLAWDEALAEVIDRGME